MLGGVRGRRDRELDRARISDRARESARPMDGRGGSTAAAAAAAPSAAPGSSERSTARPGLREGVRGLMASSCCCCCCGCVAAAVSTSISEAAPPCVSAVAGLAHGDSPAVVAPTAGAAAGGCVDVMTSSWSRFMSWGAAAASAAAAAKGEGLRGAAAAAAGAPAPSSAAPQKQAQHTRCVVQQCELPNVAVWLSDGLLNDFRLAVRVVRLDQQSYCIMQVPSRLRMPD